jgi:nitrogen regulatory protein PII
MKRGFFVKEIRAYIEPIRLFELTQSLLDLLNFPGMRVSDCEYCLGNVEINEDSEFKMFMKKKRIEIFASDDMVDSIVKILTANAHQHCVDNVYLINTIEVEPH